MKKDKEWLKQAIKDSGLICSAKLYDLIDQLDEPKKPIIPQFVADWIEDYCDHGGTIVDMLGSLTPEFNSVSSVDNEVIQWFKKNTDTMLRALMYGYEVEKEKLYFIKEPVTGQFLIRDDSQSRGVKWVDGFSTSPSYFTETEIKAIAKRYWVFAEEVTE